MLFFLHYIILYPGIVSHSFNYSQGQCAHIDSGQIFFFIIVLEDDVCVSGCLDKFGMEWKLFCVIFQR